MGNSLLSLLHELQEKSQIFSDSHIGGFLKTTLATHYYRPLKRQPLPCVPMKHQLGTEYLPDS